MSADKCDGCGEHHLTAAEMRDMQTKLIDALEDASIPCTLPMVAVMFMIAVRTFQQNYRVPPQDIIRWCVEMLGGTATVLPVPPSAASKNGSEPLS